MIYRVSRMRLIFAILVTPVVAALGAAIAVCALYGAQAQEAFDGLGTMLLTFWSIGLWVAPLSWVYALIVQWPMTVRRSKTGGTRVIRYLTLSAIFGAIPYTLILIAFSAFLYAIAYNDSFTLSLYWHQSRLLFAGVWVSAAAGLVTGIFWWLFVNRPAPLLAADPNPGFRLTDKEQSLG